MFVFAHALLLKGFFWGNFVVQDCCFEQPTGATFSCAIILCIFGEYLFVDYQCSIRQALREVVTIFFVLCVFYQSFKDKYKF